MTILVTGGAGYIGSHMVYTALDRGEDVVVIDNLSTGNRGLVAPEAHFIEGDAGDKALTHDVIKRFGVDAIIHFAGSIIVPESVSQPLAYYANNTSVARNLIEAAVENRVRHFIFSSTAAVYGNGGAGLVSEMHPMMPLSPYGRSKMMTEWMLEDTARAHDFRYVTLRYFNVAGADPRGRTGPSSPRATHLIKRGCQVAVRISPALEIFGTDYPTPDGTGIRDYLHVSDLVEAHALALDYLRKGGTPRVMNCGYGHGSSVREVVAAIENVAGRKLPVKEAPRRAGDPASIVADSSLIRTTLGWEPTQDELDKIVASAYRWEQKLNSA